MQVSQQSNRLPSLTLLTDDRENVIPILEKYFSMSKYKSFLRQLQAYGFQRALPNPKDDPCHDTKPKRDSYRGKWTHKLFRRDKMNLCNKMTRDGKAKTDKDKADVKSKILNKKVVIVRSKGEVFRSPLSPSAQLRHAPPPPPNYHERNQQNKATAVITQQEQHRKDLAVMQQQKQHQHQQQQHLQILRNRILQQQHASHAPPPGVYHHDPRYSQHHPSQAPFHHPQHHLVQKNHTQQHPPHQGSPGQPGAPMPGGAPASLMARVKQQQEEQQRQQLQMHIHHLEQQQLLSKILAARGEAPAPPGKAPSPAAGAPGQTLLAGINYNTKKQPPPSSPQLTAVNKGDAPTPTLPKKNSATDAVSEAASELHRAELALVERRRRLIEAQEQAQKEAEALVEAEAAVRKHSTMARGGGGQQSSSVVAAQELLMRHRVQSESAKPPPLSSSENPSSRIASNEATGARNRLMGGLPLTSLLEDLDNAFKSSPPPPQLQRDHSSGSMTIVTSNNNQHKITEEEMLRARAQSPAAPSQMEHLVHRRPTSNANTWAPAPRASSPGPSASEREVMMARINAMEQIRMRDENQHQQQQQQQQSQAPHNSQQELLLKIAMAEQEEHAKRSRMGITGPPQNDASVQNAIRNAAVGLIGGTNTNSGSRKPMNGLPPGAIPPNINSQPVQSGGGGLSKEMMEMFAQTAAAAMDSKTNIDTSRASGGSCSNSKAASPPTIVPSSHSLRPRNDTSATSSGVIPPPAPTSGNAGALYNGMTGRATLKPQTSFGITHSELEAARTLMKIPGAVSQSTGEPMKGHWELVKPEELKKGAALAKALPEVVTKSANLSYETYKSMAMKLTPPNIMRIPDGWDSLMEPVYLVVDPANVASTSGAMATTAGRAPGIPSAAQGTPGRR
jgi:hypothetical protein